MVTLRDDFVNGKDELECNVTKAHRVLGYCRHHEEAIVHDFHEKLSCNMEDWKNKIKDLEENVEEEIKRSAKVEQTLCNLIEV